MISALKLQNFKAVASTDWLPLNSVTVLAGTNSCGKSTLIQPILLFKQTFAEQRPRMLLNLNGPLVKLGQLQEVVTNHDRSRPVVFGFQMQLPRTWPVTRSGYRQQASSETRQLEVTVGFTAERQDIRISQLALKILGGPETDSVEFKRVASGKYDVTFSSLALSLDGFYSVGRVLRTRSYVSGLDKTPVVFKGVQVDFHGFIPISISGQFGRVLKSSLTSIGMPESDWPEVENCLRRESPGRRRELPLSPRLSFRVIEALRRAFGSVSYIGPLREEPRRHYVYEQGAALDIGSRGEYAAQILFLEQRDKVRFFPSVQDQHEVEMTLMEAVRYWICEQFSMADQLKIDTVDNAIYQVRLAGPTDSGVSVTISDVGFGVSQVLPIVVEGLRSKQGATLILEQPEIHLHPRVQSRLADFIMCMARSGRRIILETHSDHLVTRLRRRIAEDASGELSKLVAMYFVRQEQGTSLVEPLVLDEYGVIANWPRDFFDEADLDLRALVAAQAAKLRITKVSKE